MLFDLIAVIAAGFMGAGLFLILNRILGKRLPRWGMPVAAGLAMISMSVWSEYTWAARTMAGLPDGVVVVREVPSSVWYRPWTYAKPQVLRFAAVDAEAAKRNLAQPARVLAPIYLFARWQPTQRVSQVVDCDRQARADLRDEAALDGDIAEEAWVELPAGDGILTALCGS